MALNKSALKSAIEGVLGVDEIKEENFKKYNSDNDSFSTDSDAMNTAKSAISQKASQLADAIETFVKSGDVTVTVPSGTFSQGAGPSAVPNPSPVPLRNGTVT